MSNRGADEILAAAGVERDNLAGDGTDEATLAKIAARYAPVDWETAWKGRPEGVEWLIPPILEAGTVNVLFAKPGVGKSLLALQMALMLVRDGRTVVYIDDENRVSDVVERLQAYGASPGELPRLLLYSFAGLPPLDTIAGGVHLHALAATAGASLVTLDTTTRMVQGRENDADTFLQLYRCSLVPLKADGITVLRLDHPGKDETRGQRGSAAKDGDADTIWRLTEITQGRSYRLHREKNRTGHSPDTEDLTVERRYAPLRHVWAVPDRSLEIEACGQVCGQLDRLGVPRSAGRDRCRTALNNAGIAVSNDLLSKVVRQRRYAPDSSRTAGQPSG
jgi:AAA domain